MRKKFEVLGPDGVNEIYLLGERGMGKSSAMLFCACF